MKGYKLKDELYLISIRSITMTGEDEFNIGLAEGNIRNLLVKGEYLNYLSSDSINRTLHVDVVVVRVSGIEYAIAENTIKYKAKVIVGDEHLLGLTCSTDVYKLPNKKERYLYTWGAALHPEGKQENNLLYKSFMDYKYVKRILSSKAVKNRNLTSQFIKMIDDIILSEPIS